MDAFSTAWYRLRSLVNIVEVSDVLDVLVVAFIIYQVINLVKETRAQQLIKGFVVLMVLYIFADWLGMDTLRFFMQTVLGNIVLAAFIVFQPEIRRALEQVGRSRFSRLGESLNVFSSSQEESGGRMRWIRFIDALCDSCVYLCKQKFGALIVIERQTKLGEIIKTGTVLDADPSSNLIGNIFFVNSPLHDGALVVRGGKLYAAGCFLPLSDNMTISKMLGTRHRAGLGMSENSDAIVVIVSEETSVISVARNGQLKQNYTIDQLGALLPGGAVGGQQGRDREEDWFLEGEKAMKNWVDKLFKDKRMILLISVAIAIISWVAVQSNSDEPRSQRITDIPIDFSTGSEISSQMELQPIGVEDLTCQVYVEAVPTVLGTITADDISVTPSLTNVTGAGTYDLPLTYRNISNKDFTITRQSPETIRVNFDRLLTRTIPIEADINGLTYPEDCLVEQEIINPSQVTLTGPEIDLASVDRCVVELDLSEPISSPKVLQGEIKLLDAEGNRGEQGEHLDGCGDSRRDHPRQADGGTSPAGGVYERAQRLPGGGAGGADDPIPRDPPCGGQSGYYPELYRDPPGLYRPEDPGHEPGLYL